MENNEEKMSKQYIDKDLAKRIANRIYSLIIAYNQPITSEKDKNLAKLETEIANISFDADNNSSNRNNQSLNDTITENIVDKNIESKINNINDNLSKINDRFKQIDLYNELLDAHDRSDINLIHDYIYDGKLEELHNHLVSDGLTIDNFSDFDKRLKELDKKIKILESVNNTNDIDSMIDFKVFKGYEKINDGFELHYSEFKVPKRKHPTDTGWDGYVCFPDEYDKEKTIYPGKTETIPLGIIIDIPKGYEIQVRPRSGLSSKGILVSFGSVDENYRGVIKASIYNGTKEPFIVKQHDRICQLVPAKKANEICDFIEADDNDYYDETDRGANGFGSTGI